LGQEMGFKILDNYCSLTAEVVNKYGGKALLDNFYELSITKALQDVYPLHNWITWEIPQSLPPSYWSKKENIKLFMDWLGYELGFKELRDWYGITVKQIAAKGGAGLLNTFGNSTHKLLQSVYSEHQWKFRSRAKEDSKLHKIGFENKL
jgi:hypothetical protein